MTRTSQTFQLEVTCVARGTIHEVNTHKARVQAEHQSSATMLAYWTTIAEAPRVGAVLDVVVTEAAAP